MVMKYLVGLVLTGLSATALSPLEMSLHHSVADYKEGFLSAEEMMDVDDEVAPFLKDLAVFHPVPASKHRSKRSLPEGPIHFIELTVDKAEKVTSFDVSPGAVMSNIVPLPGDPSLGFFMVENLVHVVTNGFIQKLNCGGCTLSYLPIIGSANYKIVLSEIFDGGTSILQVLLSHNSPAAPEQYSRVTFLITKLESTGGDLDVTFQQDFQVVSLTTPITAEDSLARVTMHTADDGRLVFASFHRNRNNQRAEGLHLMVYDVNSLMFVPLDQSEFLLNNLLLREWINDIKLVKIFDEDRLFLVVARREKSYCFEVDLHPLAMRVKLLQTFLIPDPISIHWTADSVGTFVKLLESDGTLHFFAWDGVSFTQTSTYNFPGLVDYSWRSVALTTSADLPTQALVALANGEEVQFFHHAMPGVLERMDEPSGLAAIMEQCVNCAIVDLARITTEPFVDTPLYILLLNNNGTLEYVSLHLNPTEHTLGTVNDVSICLLDLESQLRKDQELVESMGLQEADLVRLDDLTFSALHVNNLTVLGSASILTLSLSLETDYSDVTALDLDNPDSELNTSVRKLNVSDSSFIYGNVFLPSLSLAGADLTNFSIIAPEVRINQGTFDVFSVEEVGGVLLSDLLTNTLRMTGDQDIHALMTFPMGLNSQAAIVNSSATATGVGAITVKKYFDKTRPVVFEDEVTFSHVVFRASPSVETVNDIEVSQVVTAAEMNGDTQITINGEKTCEAGLSAYTITASLLNGVNYMAWKDSLLYKNEPTQEISVDKMNFGNITVNNAVTIDLLHGMNVSFEALSDIVRTDQEAVITADCVFHVASTADDLVTSSLNGHDPAKLLIKNIPQDILVPVTASQISATSIQSGNINGIDITTQAAKVDEENNIMAPVTFEQEVTVTNSILMDEGVTLAGMDPSEVVISKQVYTAPVTVNGKLSIDAPNVVASSITIGEELITTLTAEGLEDDFLVRDAAQILPYLASIPSEVNIVEMVANSTIDNLLLNNVLHTTGDQTIDATSLVFTQTTFFEEDIQVRPLVDNVTFDQDATIAGTNIHDLESNVFCNRSPDDFRQMGSLIIQSDGGADHGITSHFDVDVKEHFVINKDGEDKDFLKFDETAARLRHTNQFTELVDFTSSTGLLINGDFTANKPIVGATLNTTLNGEVLTDFEDSIVKKTGSYHITGPVTFKHIQGDTLMAPGIGLFDGKDLVGQLDDHVLLDDSVTILPRLVSDNIIFSGPSALHVNPVEGDNAYFSGEDLVDFINNDLLQKGDVIRGNKYIEGNLRVDGDITVNSESNANHPFGVNLNALSTNNLRLSVDQTIVNQVRMNDLKVRKLYTNQVNGIEISNLNFINGNVEVKKEGAGYAVVFENGVDFTGGIAVDGLLNGTSATDRNATLNGPRVLDSVTQLTVDGDVQWTTDQPDGIATVTLSNLFDVAVVKSDRDWPGNTPNTLHQEIVAPIVFNGNVTVNNVNLATGFINPLLEDECDLLTLFNDSARLSRANVFEASKTFDGTVTVSNSLNMLSLDTAVVNGVNLADFYTTALLRASPDGNETFVQTVEESWTMANGFIVSGEAALQGTINGLQVGDLVYKSIVEEAREIPAITLAKGATVTGNVVGDDSALKGEIDALLAGSLKVDEAATLNMPLTLTGQATMDEITVASLNGIDTSTIVLTGTEALQTINQDLVLPQSELTIQGNLQADFVNTMAPTQFNTDALRVDRAETILTHPLSFQGEVVIEAENVTINDAPEELNSLIPMWLNTLRGFTLDLLDFYTENIIKPIRDVVKEVFVAKNLGVGRPKYLEKMQLAESLKLDDETYDVIGLDSLDFREGGFMMSVEKGYTGDRCGQPESCQCNETRLVTGGDFKNYQLYEFTEKVFTFRLSSGFYTVTVKYDGSSDDCPSADASAIVVTGVQLDPAASAVNLTATSVDHLGTVLGETTIPGGYAVTAMQMWDLGTSLYIAIAPGYSTNVVNANLLVYELAGGTWVPETITELPASPIAQMIINSFKVTGGDGVERENVHLLVVQEVEDPNDAKVDVYEWTHLPATAEFPTVGERIQDFSAPGISSFDVMRIEPSKETSPIILVALALRFERFFNPTSYIEFLQYSASEGKYVNAVVPDRFTEIGSIPIIKIKSRQISDTSALLVSTEEGVSVYSFLPNQGIRLVSDYEVRGKLLDMAVYHETLPRVLAKEKSSTLIYLLTELWGVRRSELLAVKIQGKIDIPDVVFSIQDLGSF